MIISLRIRNFLSIKYEVFVDFTASGSKQLSENVLNYKRKRLLKALGVYGANASGKSNIIKAFFFIWQLTKTSHSYNIDTPIPPTQFKLDAKKQHEPSRFEITFTKNDSTFQYGFSCLNSVIIDEFLFRWDETYDKPRKSIIFIRRNSSDFEFKTDIQKQEAIKTQMTRNVLYLSRATALNYEGVRDAYEFLVNDLIISFNTPIDPWSNYTKITMSSNPDLKTKIVDILQKADFGGISDIVIEKKKGKNIGFHLNLSKEGFKFDPIPETEVEIYLAKYLHKGSNDRLIEFTESEESAGTLKMFSMLGPIFDILENGKVLIIDELESSLHPGVSEFVVRLFHSKVNKKSAQLLFVTHNTNLLSRGILRRDQILITRNEKNEGTKISSLTDFKLREGIDFERAYLTGRVGGVPFIDETILE